MNNIVYWGNLKEQKKIFIDGGSHLGESVKKFRSLYDKNNKFIYYMFEPNLLLFNNFKDKEEFKECKKFNVGLSSKNENNVKLWGGDNKRYGLETCGATINETKKLTDKYKEEEFSLINIISLSEFINKEFKNGEEIVLKLDIEGAEYDVFEDLIQTGVIKKVSKIYCEFHTQWLSLDYREREQKIREEIKNLNIPLEDLDALND
jgi:FkbM family methyltransferase